MRLVRCRVVTAVFLLWAFCLDVGAGARAGAQFGDWKKKAMQAAACGGGAIGGYNLGKKISDMEAQRLHLPPALAEAQRKKFEIGMALALCNGGSALVGTTFAKMDERDKKQRQTEIDAAVADTGPVTKTYALPDHPELKETIVTSPVVADSGNECKTVEDTLADTANGDTALVKYCRKPPATDWKLASV